MTHFWEMLDDLVTTSELRIDRPKGSTHPRFSPGQYQAVPAGCPSHDYPLIGDALQAFLMRSASNSYSMAGSSQSRCSCGINPIGWPAEAYVDDGDRPGVVEFGPSNT